MTRLRIVIIVAVLVVWEALAASGLLYRDVVPSLVAIGKALYVTLADATFYFHLYTTFYEIGIAMLIGGLSGLAVGIVLGGSKFMSRAYEAYLYYLGPCPKIIFFPIMIMWFGVGPGSKIAMGAISCFFPVALNVAGGMREIDKVLIRVGRSFRANTWQMVTKIYLPAMRHPVINGVRLGSRRRADRHAAGGNQAFEPRHRLSGHPGLQHLQHAADVCAADHPVRDRDRRQYVDRPARRPRRHQAILTEATHELSRRPARRRISLRRRQAAGRPARSLRSSACRSSPPRSGHPHSSNSPRSTMP